MSTMLKGVPVLTPDLAREMIAKAEQDIEMFKTRANAPGYVGESNRRLIVQFEADIARLRAMIEEKENGDVRVEGLAKNNPNHL